LIHRERALISDLLDIVAIGYAVVAEQVAVVPDFVDEIGSGG
jgi:hypothetical protein